MSDRSKPLTTPEKGYELCYECDGARLCWSCCGVGRRSNGDQCGQCAGRGLCIVCNGDGQLPFGTKANVFASDDAVAPIGTRPARMVGRYRELGFDDACSLEPLLRTGSETNREKAVAYLKAGKTLVLTPQLLKDVFDQSRTPGSRSILTDGTFAWPAGLAYYVSRYGIPVPPELEQHMAKNDWRIPAEIDPHGLRPS